MAFVCHCIGRHGCDQREIYGLLEVVEEGPVYIGLSGSMCGDRIHQLAAGPAGPCSRYSEPAENGSLFYSLRRCQGRCPRQRSRAVCGNPLCGAAGG